MRFVIKLLVFGFVALAILPAFAPAEFRPLSSDHNPSEDNPSVVAVASVLVQAAGDLKAICSRQPEMCETGREVLAYTGGKARDGLVIAYAMFRHGHPSMKED